MIGTRGSSTGRIAKLRRRVRRRNMRRVRAEQAMKVVNTQIQNAASHFERKQQAEAL